MKKIVTLLLFSPVFFSAFIHAQGQMEAYGLRTWATPTPQYTDKGWGGGINYLTDPFVLNGKDKLHPFDVQFGGQFYISSWGGRKFKGVPLDEPLTGNAKVKFNNVLFGINGFVRFSFPNKNTGYMPYLDVLGGARFISCQMNVIPDHVPIGYDANTSTELKSLAKLNYGVGVGLQKKISEECNLDFELIWTYSPYYGDMVNLNSVRRVGDGLVYDLKSSPNSVMLLKVGLNFGVTNSSSGSSGSSSCSRHSTYCGSYHGRSSSVHVSSGGHSSGGGVHAVAK